MVASAIAWSVELNLVWTGEFRLSHSRDFFGIALNRLSYVNEFTQKYFGTCHYANEVTVSRARPDRSGNLGGMKWVLSLKGHWMMLADCSRIACCSAAW
jgi:hypothetical protein